MPKLQTNWSSRATTALRRWMSLLKQIPQSSMLGWPQANFAGGLSRLRHVNTADARSNTFSMLIRHQGRQHALAWLDANRPTAPTFFTPLGWRNAAVALSEAGRWEDAAACLEALPPDAAEECPDIPYVDGTINAALTLPALVRRFALTMHVVAMPIEPLQGAEAAARHRRALLSFASARKALNDVGEKIRAALAETWRTWLLLTEPSTRQEGERIVLEAMRDGERAVDYAQLADTFRISFDPAPLERHLNIRELAGGLSPLEMAAKLVLYRQTRPRPRSSSFLRKDERAFSAVMTSEGYDFLLVTALIDAGQLERAQEILRDKRDSFGEDFDRIQDQIRARRGEDVSRSVEDRFLATDEDVDLQLLCDALRESEDLDRLRRYSLELFRRQRNLRNAARVCDALARGYRHKEILDFLSTAGDLVAIDDDLAAGKARSLFLRRRSDRSEGHQRSASAIA